MPKRSPLTACVSGTHKPRSPIERDRSGVERTHCRVCGCALMRTAATRRWYFSGLIGDGPMSVEPIGETARLSSGRSGEVLAVRKRR